MRVIRAVYFEKKIRRFGSKGENVGGGRWVPDADAHPRPELDGSMKRLVMGDTDKLMISSGGQWKRMSSSRQRGRSQRQDGGRRGLMEPPTVTTDAAACRKRPLTKIPAESMSEINESFRFSGQRRLVEVNATATRHADADGRPSVNGRCRRWPSVTDGSFIYVLVLVIAAAVLSAVIVTLGLRMRPVTQWHWPVARPVDGWMQPLPPRSRQFFLPSAVASFALARRVAAILCPTATPT